MNHAFGAGGGSREAPRITSSEVRRALDDPRALCERLGLGERARRQRGGLMILCPWHQEKTPSCSVRATRDGSIAVKCHACGASGDALSLVAIARGLDVKKDFPAVLAEAASIAGLHVAAGAIRVGPSLAKAGAARAARARHLEPEPRLDDAVFAAMAEVILAAGRLDEGPIAADVTRYLARRGVLDEAREDGWAALPPPGEAQAAWAGMLRDAFGEQALKLSGLAWLREGAYALAYPRHRLVIPWRSPEGRVITLQRRRIDGITERKYVFPAGRPARWPYGIDRLRRGARPGEEPPLAIVEGAIDALAFRRLARRDGQDCAVLGLASARSWDSAWARLAGPRALIGVDGDRAGHSAVGGIVHDMVLAGVERLERWIPRAGKDWADTVAAEELRR